MKKSILYAFIILPSISIASEWTGNVKVDWVRAYPGDSTSHYVQISDASINEGCSVTAASRIIKISDNGGRVYSAVLAATMSERNVRFWLDGCTTNGYAIVKEIQVNGRQ